MSLCSNSLLPLLAFRLLICYCMTLCLYFRLDCHFSLSFPTPFCRISILNLNMVLLKWVQLFNASNLITTPIVIAHLNQRYYRIFIYPRDLSLRLQTFSLLTSFSNHFIIYYSSALIYFSIFLSVFQDDVFPELLIPHLAEYLAYFLFSSKILSHSRYSFFMFSRTVPLKLICLGYSFCLSSQSTCYQVKAIQTYCLHHSNFAHLFYFSIVLRLWFYFYYPNFLSTAFSSQQFYFDYVSLSFVTSYKYFLSGRYSYQETFWPFCLCFYFFSQFFNFLQGSVFRYIRVFRLIYLRDHQVVYPYIFLRVPKCLIIVFEGWTQCN